MTASPIAEEAARLAQAFQEWLAGASASISIATESQECALCPFCQLLRRVRTCRPEVFDHLAGAATEAGTALRSFLDQSANGHVDDRRTESGDGPIPDSRSGHDFGGLEHIAIETDGEE